jgi:hypothetical protein
MARPWDSTADFSAVTAGDSASELLDQLKATWELECILNDVQDDNPGRAFPAASFPQTALVQLLRLPAASRVPVLEKLWWKALATARPRRGVRRGLLPRPLAATGSAMSISIAGFRCVRAQSQRASPPYFQI